jgi:transposase
MIHTAVGFDANKKIKGRKRHLLVDTLGLMILVVVSAASVPERAGANLVFAKLHLIRENFPRLVRIWVDAGYEGKGLMHLVMDTYRWIVETIKRSELRRNLCWCPDTLGGGANLWMVELVSQTEQRL